MEVIDWFKDHFWAIEAVVILLLAWGFFRWKNYVYSRVKAKSHEEEHNSLEVLNKIGTVFILAVSLLLLLSLLNIDVVPIVTFGGIGAAALGFASKDVMANFFGGLMIYISRPFIIHDLIELPQKEQKGHVEQIGWYFTSLRNLDKKLVYIPNSFFTSNFVTNLSRMTYHYFNEVIRIRYADADKVALLTEKIRKFLEKHSDVDPNSKIYVHLSEMSDVGLDLEVKVYLHTSRYEHYMEVRQNMLLALGRLIEESGAKRPWPTTTVELIQS